MGCEVARVGNASSVVISTSAIPSRLLPLRVRHAVDLRHQRYTLRRIAKAVGAPLSTVGRVMQASGPRKAANPGPQASGAAVSVGEPVDVIYVDNKPLARFERIGHRITGDRHPGCSAGASFEKVPVAIDDATRLAHAEPCIQTFSRSG